MLQMICDETGMGFAAVARVTDEVLMQDLAQGSHSAFEELLRRYESPVITFCYAFLRNREAAEGWAAAARRSAEGNRTVTTSLMAARMNTELEMGVLPE